MPKVLVTCRVCLQQENPENSIQLFSENETTIDLLEKLIYCIPEIDLNLVINPVICKPCERNLKNAFQFKKQCLKNEEKLLKYREKCDFTAQIDLQKVNFLSEQNSKCSTTSKNDGAKNKECQGCTIMSKDPVHHLKVKSDIFICYVCNRTYDDIQQLRKHSSNHSPKHICKICGKHTRDQCQLRTHLRVHSGEKPFECRECGNKYKQPFALREHMLKHNNNTINRCKCEKCGKILSSKYNLKIHMKQHNSDYVRTLGKRQRRKRKPLDSEFVEMNVIKLEEFPIETEAFDVNETNMEIKQENLNHIMHMAPVCNDNEYYKNVLPEFPEIKEEKKENSNVNLAKEFI